MLTRLLLFTCTAATLLAQTPGRVTLPLWPQGAPGASANALAESDATTEKDNLVAGKRLIRLGHVSTPTLTVYPATAGNSGAAVVVFPGGGYNILAYDLEGSEVCDWLNRSGVTCVLVKYRVPGTGPYPKSAAALQDAQRAVGMVRQHAAEWNIDAQRIGVLGFSAGGHLAAAISTHFETRLYPAVDAADQLSCRPDFSILIYPAYLVKPGTETLQPDMPVTAQTPPAILIQAEDDPAAPVENSLAYYEALKRAKVPAEMHLYAEGGHGYGLRRTELPVTGWPAQVEVWLRTMKLLGAAGRR